MMIGTAGFASIITGEMLASRLVLDGVGNAAAWTAGRLTGSAIRQPIPFANDFGSPVDPHIAVASKRLTQDACVPIIMMQPVEERPGTGAVAAQGLRFDITFSICCAVYGSPGVSSS
jgi:hypothetical protein